MKRCFAYIRVSTARQGEHGASLDEQRDAIERYAERLNLAVVEWFEEVETAAKRGRRIFAGLVKQLRAKKADGLIMHKIDRSTRNYYDWAEINELVDRGIEIHFANENLELGSRGRRLMADIQAVFATDYIRNLREEIHKGINGRLKAGLLPWAAPIGYLDHGRGGTMKTICPVAGPLVRQAFELYATGRYTLDTLLAELRKRGLRAKRGGQMTVSGLSSLLRNRFYIGLIKQRKSGAVYPGGHEPLVPVTLFQRVQDVLEGRVQRKVQRNEFRYRLTFSCQTCGRFLVGERQKGHVYYRCHNRGCPTCVREEALEAAVTAAYAAMELAPSEVVALQEYVRAFLSETSDREADQAKTLQLQLSALKQRQERLVDALVDGHLSKDIYEARHATLLTEQRAIEEQGSRDQSTDSIGDRTLRMFELAASALQSHGTANDAGKREQLELLSSNRTGSGRQATIELSFPFCMLSKHVDPLKGARVRGRVRTLKPRYRRVGRKHRLVIPRPLRHRFKLIFHWCKQNPDALKVAEQPEAGQT